ncbi:hypothetical protein NKH77_51930 [Streptomyces sp. M19]
MQTNYGLLLSERPGGGPADLTLGIAHVQAGLGERSPRGTASTGRTPDQPRITPVPARRTGRSEEGRAVLPGRPWPTAPGRRPVLWSQLQCNLADLLLAPGRGASGRRGAADRPGAADRRGARAAATAVVAFDAAHPGLVDTSRATWLLARIADLLDGPGAPRACGCDARR